MNPKIGKLFDAGMKALEEKRKIFCEIEENPELILTKLFDPSNGKHQPFYSFPFLVFGSDEELIGEKFHYHDMQEYLAKLLNAHFRTIDSSVNVNVGQGNTYASAFKISFEKRELFRFDIYRRRFSESKGWSKESHEQNAKSYQEEIARHEEAAAKYQNFIENPKKELKSLREQFLYWRKKEKIQKNAQKRVESLRAAKRAAEEHLEQLNRFKEEYEAAREEIEKKKAFWREKFQTWQYDEREKGSIY